MVAATAAMVVTTTAVGNTPAATSMQGAIGMPVVNSMAEGTATPAEIVMVAGVASATASMTTGSMPSTPMATRSGVTARSMTRG